jgi:hypothetical protein
LQGNKERVSPEGPAEEEGCCVEQEEHLKPPEEAILRIGGSSIALRNIRFSFS